MDSRVLSQKEMKILDWTLRVSMFGEFLGHGATAYGLSPTFLAMLRAMTGITGFLANTLMQMIGAFDMFVAFLVLVKPIRVILAWGVVWAFLTALARPISGDQIWGFVERWGNVGIPLALLLIRGWPKTAKEWFS